MAAFDSYFSKEVIEQFQKLDINLDKMLGEMVEAGAEVALSYVKTKMPRNFRDSIGEKNISLTKVYKTPSDDGVNCQVMITGYFQNEYDVKTPAPLVANMFEYGSSVRQNYPKHPFFRTSFRKGPIEKAMLDVQRKYIEGDNTQ